MKPKTDCHVCQLTMKTPVNQESPCVKADIIAVILTNKRIIFMGQHSAGTGEWVGWFLDGIIGKLIVGALSGKEGKWQGVSAKFEDMTSFNAEFGTKLLNKNSKIFTISDKGGKTYEFQPSKKN